jgi:RimJ/RimL family protein N-acetyltransferase
MAKRALTPLEGEHARLRLLEETDLRRTLDWRNTPSIRQWFLNSDLLTWEQHHGWFARYLDRENDFIFVIEERIAEGWRPIGQASIYEVDWDQQAGIYGRLMIGEPDAAGRGFAKEATVLSIKMGFDVLGLRRLSCEILETNGPSLAVCQKCGYQITHRKDGLAYLSIERESAQA